MTLVTTVTYPQDNKLNAFGDFNLLVKRSNTSGLVLYKLESTIHPRTKRLTRKQYLDCCECVAFLHSSSYQIDK